LLNFLKEVEVTGMRGSEHEVTFVKQLFNWVTSLEKMRVVFDESVTESVAKELSQVLRSFARPEIRMEIHT
jgi:acid stress-induced BolA-like protein IbaG/YrbA